MNRIFKIEIQIHMLREQEIQCKKLITRVLQSLSEQHHIIIRLVKRDINVAIFKVNDGFIHEIHPYNKYYKAKIVSLIVPKHGAYNLTELVLNTKNGAPQYF